MRKRMWGWLAVLAVLLKGAQRFMHPLLCSTVTAGEWFFLCLLVLIGLGVAALLADHPGPAFVGLYLRCTVVCCLCKTVAVVMVMQAGAHWVCVHYAMDALAVLMCAWRFEKYAGGKRASAFGTIKQHIRRYAAGCGGILGVMAFVQGVVIRCCAERYLRDSAMYWYSLRHLWLWIAAGELITLVFAVWMGAVHMPEFRKRPRFGMVLLATVVILSITIGLYSLFRPEGLAIRMSNASSTSYIRAENDSGSDEPVRIKEFRLRLERRWNHTAVDDESLHLLWIAGVPDGDCILVTEAIDRESIAKDGGRVEILYPYGLVSVIGEERQWLPFSSLPDQPESEFLTSFCKMHLMDFRLFAPCARYLCRYDPEAVLQTLERFAKGDFLPGVVSLMGDLRPEYVMNEAERILDDFRSGHLYPAHRQY